MGADAESGRKQKEKEEDVASPQGRSAKHTGGLAVAASTKPVDDLTELLSRAALLQSQYREFESEPRAPKEIATAPTPDTKRDAKADTGPDLGRDIEPDRPARTGKVSAQVPIQWRRQPEPESERVARMADRYLSVPENDAGGDASGLIPQAEASPRRNANEEREPSPREGREGERTGRKQFNSAGASRWSVLGQVLSTEGDAADDRLIRALGASIAIPFQFAASVSGGTGVTTILATLARCLATQGERLLLADPGASSLLPLYFGASNPGEGELQSFLMPDSDAGVAIVNSRQSAPGSSIRSHVPSESRRTLIATIRNAAAHSDRLLLDAGAVRASDAQSLRRGTHFGLMPVVPDLSCMFGLTRLEDALQSREGDGSPAAAIYYVLNKFDSSLALHRDIKASLEGRLGERLAPVTIRRSDAVAEALADGMTVIDYCPDAGVAEDFQRLADWIRRMAPVGHVHQDESR